MKYWLTADPGTAALGSAVLVTLRANAESDSPTALTFDHGSLTLELSCPDPGREPRVAFPNRRVTIKPGMLMRESAPGGAEDLPAGAELCREFHLEEVFPLEILNTGVFLITFSLSDGTHIIRPEPARFRIVSSPEAVSVLFKVLDEETLSRRSRAAELLQRMTFRGFDYDAAADPTSQRHAGESWLDWWRMTGSTLRWSFNADGATIGKTLPPPSNTGMSGHTGGIFYEAVPLADESLAELTGRLAEWSASGELSDLYGGRRVSDRVVDYPDEGYVVDDAPKLRHAMLKAIENLTMRVQAGENQATAAAILLATVIAAPSRAYREPLTRLGAIVPREEPWTKVSKVCRALANALPTEALVV